MQPQTICRLAAKLRRTQEDRLNSSAFVKLVMGSQLTIQCAYTEEAERTISVEIVRSATMTLSVGFYSEGWRLRGVKKGTTKDYSKCITISDLRPVYRDDGAVGPVTGIESYFFPVCATTGGYLMPEVDGWVRRGKRLNPRPVSGVPLQATGET